MTLPISPAPSWCTHGHGADSAWSRRLEEQASGTCRACLAQSTCQVPLGLPEYPTGVAVPLAQWIAELTSGGTLLAERAEVGLRVDLLPPARTSPLRRQRSPPGPFLLLLIFGLPSPVRISLHRQPLLQALARLPLDFDDAEVLISPRDEVSCGCAVYILVRVRGHCEHDGCQVGAAAIGGRLTRVPRGNIAARRARCNNTAAGSRGLIALRTVGRRPQPASGALQHL
mmetsp:Transcript_99029/g.263141  ORF Transcript_99029/g.263141 Transcript_99029/m.263141 type:complete len:228 (+) Transcript_99029:256-939(+)